MRLCDVFNHFPEHAQNVPIGYGVQHALSLPLELDEARRTQQAQMVADQGRAQVQRGGKVTHGDGPRQAGGDDAQPRGVAKQAEQVGQLGQMRVSRERMH